MWAAPLQNMTSTDIKVAFKKDWRKGDLEPGSEERRREADLVIRRMSEHQSALPPKLSWARILRWLDVHHNLNRQVVADINDACAMMGLFFHPKFLESTYGAAHKNCLLLKQKGTFCIICHFRKY